METTYKRMAAYLSGGICGDLWMPQVKAGKPFRANARGPWGFFDRFTEPASFREALLSVLAENGGDFRNPAFTADTVIRIERRKITGNYQYTVHVWERTIAELPDCEDLIDSEAYTGDFLGED